MARRGGPAACASNTDAYGFMTNLDEQAPDWNEGGGRSMVLGAGGAARAILLWPDRGGRVRGFCSPIGAATRAEALARGLSAPAVEVVDWEAPRPRACRLRPARQHDEPRHDRQGRRSRSILPRCLPTRSWPISSIARSRRALLAAARARGNRRRRRARHAAASGGAGLRALVRRPPRSDA